MGMELSLLEERHRCANILAENIRSPAVIATIMGISEGELKALLDNATVAQLVEHSTTKRPEGAGVEGSSPSGGPTCMYGISSQEIGGI